MKNYIFNIFSLTPIEGDLKERLEKLASSDQGALFDLTEKKCDILIKDNYRELLEYASEIGVGVAVRVEYSRLRTRRATLESLCEEGLVDEIRIIDNKDRLVGGGLMQRLSKHHPEFVRRLSIEVDIFKHVPLHLEDLTKPLLPDETRENLLEFDQERARKLPKILLCAGEAMDVFSLDFEERLLLWKKELSWLSTYARIAFDQDAFKMLEPYWNASLNRSKGPKIPIMCVNVVQPYR